jgi:hypothetical protein
MTTPYPLYFFDTNNLHAKSDRATLINCIGETDGICGEDARGDYLRDNFSNYIFSDEKEEIVGEIDNYFSSL